MLKTFLSTISSIIHFSVEQQINGPVYNKLQRPDNLIYSDNRKEFCKKMLHTYFKEIWSVIWYLVSVYFYHFEELRWCATQNIYINKLRHVAKYFGKSFSMQNSSKNVSSVQKRCFSDNHNFIIVMMKRWSIIREIGVMMPQKVGKKKRLSCSFSVTPVKNHGTK